MVIRVPHWSTQRTQHLHVYQHLFGFFPGSLGCEVQSCSFRGSPAFGAVGETTMVAPWSLWEPGFFCASSKWTARGSDCTTIKVVFATLLVTSKCLNKREKVLKFFDLMKVRRCSSLDCPSKKNLVKLVKTQLKPPHTPQPHNKKKIFVF